jgi:hypothetical protein
MLPTTAERDKVAKGKVESSTAPFIYGEHNLRSLPAEIITLYSRMRFRKAFKCDALKNATARGFLNEMTCYCVDVLRDASWGAAIGFSFCFILEILLTRC